MGSGQRQERTCTYSELVYETYERLRKIRGANHVVIDGETLDIHSVVAVSRYDISPKLDERPGLSSRVKSSVATLEKILRQGQTIYGVNTGFGGSADTRSDHSEALQSALLQHYQFGILSPQVVGAKSYLSSLQISTHAMPSEWVKGTMLVRCNSIVRGHSAVSLHLIETIMSSLQHNLTPVVPLRGSIFASGDLSPLSYIAGAITGNPDIYVRTEKGIVSAEGALQQVSVSPITLGPKEGLGLINGTATSAAVASLALYETHHLAILSQILTSMALEALLGSVGNYDPFIARVRPHEGQTESARAVRQFLQGSGLARGFGHDQDDRQSSGLLYHQDRYALRTASQWIGPQIEDLTLAHRQITTELNSTTDNPLVDVIGETTHHGGNFQAVSITSAIEKIRLSLQMIGKLLFAQCSELINPMLNNGLPPNLAADEPSLSYTMKGVDIGMASYMSELAFLANPSVDLVSLMSASYLYTVCQALDLRVLQRNFFQNLEPTLYQTSHEIFGAYLISAAIQELHNKLWTHVKVTWLLTSNKDTHERVDYIVNMALAILTEYFISEDTQPYLSEAAASVRTWKSQAKKAILDCYVTTRTQFFAYQNTIVYLGKASSNMYTFVRKTLGVPFHKGLENHPTPREPDSIDGARKQTIGSWIGIIYESLRDGRLHEPLMRCLVDADLVPVTDLAHRTLSDGSNATNLMINARLNSYTADNPTKGFSVDHGTNSEPAKLPDIITTTNGHAVNSNGTNGCAKARLINGHGMVGTSRGVEKQFTSPSSVGPIPGNEKGVHGIQSSYRDQSNGGALKGASKGEEDAIDKTEAHNSSIRDHTDIDKTQSHPMDVNVATESSKRDTSRTHRKSKSSSSVGFWKLRPRCKWSICGQEPSRQLDHGSRCTHKSLVANSLSKWNLNIYIKSRERFSTLGTGNPAVSKSDTTRSGNGQMLITGRLHQLGDAIVRVLER